MTINIFVLKGDLNGKIVVVRFFFCRVYITQIQDSQIININGPNNPLFLRNPYTGTFANSEDPDEMQHYIMLHFIRVYTVFKGKKYLQSIQSIQ